MVEMKYFDKYAQLVYSGKIRVCELTMKSIKRVERYKEQYIFKQEEVDKRIEFIEEECSNTKGLAGK
ncbi:terminase large subunit, partial [Streptococcus pneumoniae]|nr:terminase large subunit [Streptococcus pneumoniae]